MQHVGQVEVDCTPIRVSDLLAGSRGVVDHPNAPLCSRRAG
jgi:hypothetical protein